jgi:hypothetical protein
VPLLRKVRTWFQQYRAEIRRIKTAAEQSRQPPQAPKDHALLYHTGHDSAYWVEYIQNLIKRWFDAEPDNPHPHCEPGLWMTELVEHVEEKMIERAGDENMQIGLIMATILSVWTIRLAHTKAYDPRRPISLRQQALDSYTNSQAVLFSAVTDERRDADYFRLPRWDYPYDPEAMNGDFV